MAKLKFDPVTYQFYYQCPPQVSLTVRKIMRFRSITTLCLFGAASVVALKYPLVGLGICICCLIAYLKPGPPAAGKPISPE
jgi:hypothetical protein